MAKISMVDGSVLCIVLNVATKIIINNLIVLPTYKRIIVLSFIYNIYLKFLWFILK